MTAVKAAPIFFSCFFYANFCRHIIDIYSRIYHSKLPNTKFPGIYQDFLLKFTPFPQEPWNYSIQLFYMQKWQLRVQMGGTFFFRQTFVGINVNETQKASLSSMVTIKHSTLMHKCFEPAQHGFTRRLQIVSGQKHNTATNIRAAGMQQYLCFLMPFSCGTDPLFFWLLLSSTRASLKLASDTPSYDSSESRPVGEEMWHKVIVITNLATTNVQCRIPAHSPE